MKRDEAITKIEQLTGRVAASAGLEVVEVELKGAGKHQTLRITIDRSSGDQPGGGVTHADCELVSREVGDALDALEASGEPLINGAYDFQVSSPGVERALKKWTDWERFRGQKAKVVLKQPAGELKHFDGVIAQASVEQTGAHNLTVELSDGNRVTFPFEQVSRANLKFEW